MRKEEEEGRREGRVVVASMCVGWCESRSLNIEKDGCKRRKMYLKISILCNFIFMETEVSLTSIQSLENPPNPIIKLYHKENAALVTTPSSPGTKRKKRRIVIMREPYANHVPYHVPGIKL